MLQSRTLTLFSALASLLGLALYAIAQNPEDSLLLDSETDSLLVEDQSVNLLGEDTGNDLLGDQGLLGNDDLLASPQKTAAERESINDALLENRFPSATTCATCHPDHYEEWSVSAHAYSQLSPVFNAMHATIVKRTAGTNGDFCIRCHTQVGMQLEEPLFISNLDRHPTSREGITCIVCHRIDQNYGKVSGRTSLVEGDIFDPVYGPSGGEVLSQILQNPGKYKVNTDREKTGRNIHAEALKLPAMTTSGFCGSCHDVNLLNGFRLEEAFSQFKNSPAAKRGENCQDCHMGKIPGIKSGYAHAPAAVIGGKHTPPRKRTNHMFAGPDYSIVHPGIFPHNTQAQELTGLKEWLQFDHEAGWGTDAFEDNAPSDYAFPKAWKSIDDRYEARKILKDQFALLDKIETERYQVLRRALQFGEIHFQPQDSRGIRFAVEIRNGTDGHGVPTGFDAERLMFLQVTVTDTAGKIIFQSGDRDPNGDVRDIHSLYVHNWELPIDKQLFSLQSKFLTRNIRGGEREQVLAINYSLDPLPYIRPDARSTILTARSFGARKQSRGIPPSGSRWANYTIKKDALTSGPYIVNIKFICQMVPVNLIKDIEEVGFDYNMSPRQIAERIVQGSQTIWDKTFTFDGKKQIINCTPSEAEIMAPPDA